MKDLSQKLADTVTAAEAALRQVDDAQARVPILKGGWSRKQVLGHLIDSASNNHQRFVRAALQDSALEFPGYEQDRWAQLQDAQDAPWPLLVSLWAGYNHYLAHVLLHLPANKLQTACRIGGNRPMNLRELAEDYLRHLAHHMEQLGLAER